MDLCGGNVIELLADPPAPDKETGKWHVRFYALLLSQVKEVFEAKFDTYVIGKEETGENGTKHHHCWFPLDVKKDAINKMFQRITKSANVQGKKGRGNGAYAVFPWDDNIGYIIKSGVYASKGFSDEQLVVKRPVPIVASSAPVEVSSGTPVSYKIQKPKRSTKMKDVFVEHLKSLPGWVPGCITPANLSSKRKELIHIMTVYFQNAFGTDWQAKNALDHAGFYFGDEFVVEHISQMNQVYYEKILRW